MSEQALEKILDEFKKEALEFIKAKKTGNVSYQLNIMQGGITNYNKGTYESKRVEDHSR